jgi:hypothetical protein
VFAYGRDGPLEVTLGRQLGKTATSPTTFESSWVNTVYGGQVHLGELPVETREALRAIVEDYLERFEEARRTFYRFVYPVITDKLQKGLAESSVCAFLVDIRMEAHILYRGDDPLLDDLLVQFETAEAAVRDSVVDALLR